MLYAKYIGPLASNIKKSVFERYIRRNYIMLYGFCKNNSKIYLCCITAADPLIFPCLLDFVFVHA